MKIKDITESLKDENRNLNTAPSSPEDGQMSTAQAAKFLGVTMGRIRQLIRDGKLSSDEPEKGRRDHKIKAKDVKDFKKNRKPGRPSGENT